MKEIILTQGKKTIVDDEDYEELNKYKWYFKKGYAVRNIGKYKHQRTCMMHRVILNPSEEFEIDHINRIKLDNRKINLRLSTRQQNNANRSIQKHSSKYKGVYWHKASNKWMSSITFNGIQIYLGVYDNEIDAAKAYNDIAIKCFKEFALLNDV